MSRALAAAALATWLAAGCALFPGDPDRLLESSAIVAELRVEESEMVEVGRFSHAGLDRRALRDWHPYVVLPSIPRTEYGLVNSGGATVLQASAERSGSGLYRRIRIDPKRHPIVEWSWNVAQPPRGADPRVPSREDSPARLVISFHGDVKSLDFAERVTLRMYKGLTGQMLPFAMLMYVWADGVPAETIIPGVHTDKMQMIVVEGDRARAGEWLRFRRNVLEDYRRVFGADPWDIVAVGVMTDSDDTGQSARAMYGDITFRPAR